MLSSEENVTSHVQILHELLVKWFQIKRVLWNERIVDIKFKNPARLIHFVLGAPSVDFGMAWHILLSAKQKSTSYSTEKKMSTLKTGV